MIIYLQRMVTPSTTPTMLSPCRNQSASNTSAQRYFSNLYLNLKCFFLYICLFVCLFVGLYICLNQSASSISAQRYFLNLDLNLKCFFVIFLIFYITHIDNLSLFWIILNLFLVTRFWVYTLRLKVLHSAFESMLRWRMQCKGFSSLPSISETTIRITR